MFVLNGANSGATIYQYSLSTAWVVSTATYDSVTLVTSGQDNTIYDFCFSIDGTKLYVVGIGGPDSIYQYTLSTPWILTG